MQANNTFEPNLDVMIVGACASSFSPFVLVCFVVSACCYSYVSLFFDVFPKRWNRWVAPGSFLFSDR